MVVAGLFLLPGFLFAHGLLLDAKSDGVTIEGVVYYSNGEFVVHESVELRDLTSGSVVGAVQTDGAGRFEFPVDAGQRYRISAYGEEGHSVDIELDAQIDARPKLVEDDAVEQTSAKVPPAWVVIGGVLLLSLVPAAVRRLRHCMAARLSS